jgi:hypothetical protein
MAMTYTTLVADKSTAGSIKSWVNDTRVDPDVVLEDAQSLIYGQLRVREMRAITTVSLTSGQSSASLPSRFLDPIDRLYDHELGCYLTFLAEGSLIRRRTYESGVLSTSTPQAYTVANENFEFDCKAEAARTYSLAFYQRPAALSGSATTNFLTDRYPLLLRSACIALAYDFRHDDANYQRAVGRVTALVQAANVEADFSRVAQEYEVEVRG